MVEIIPAIAEKDWAALEEKVASIAPFVTWVHINISDGSMGTETTITDFSGISDLSVRYPKLHFEAHILSANPEKYVRSLADSGFTRLIAHVECNDPRRFIEESKYDDVEIGIAIDGATEIEQIEPFLEDIDFVVVMTREAGVSDGEFLPEAVEKAKLIHHNYPDLPIEVVGSISETTVKAVKDVGATRIVSSDYIFKHSAGVSDAIETLQSA